MSLWDSSTNRLHAGPCFADGKVQGLRALGDVLSMGSGSSDAQDRGPE